MGKDGSTVELNHVYVVQKWPGRYHLRSARCTLPGNTRNTGTKRMSDYVLAEAILLAKRMNRSQLRVIVILEPRLCENRCDRVVVA